MSVEDEEWIVAPHAETLSATARFKGGPHDVTPCEFWQWGFSDLRLNIVRGVLAEFLVAKAVGDPADTLRDPWGWTPLTGTSKEREIRAQVFVFCMQTAKTHDEYDPLDVDQWQFWVINASEIRKRGTRSVGMQFVKGNSETYKWAELEEAVKKVFQGNHRT